MSACIRGDPNTTSLRISRSPLHEVTSGTKDRVNSSRSILYDAPLVKIPPAKGAWGGYHQNRGDGRGKCALCDSRLTRKDPWKVVEGGGTLHLLSSTTTSNTGLVFRSRRSFWSIPLCLACLRASLSPTVATSISPTSPHSFSLRTRLARSPWADAIIRTPRSLHVRAASTSSFLPISSTTMI